MNIIAIVSDTLRYDCLSCHGRQPYGWDLEHPLETPHLDAFAREAVIFDRGYQASFPTIPTRTDMFTGKLTYPHRGWTPLPEDETILAEELGKVGYQSMLICDTPHLIRDGHRFDRGFTAWHWNRGQEGDRAILADLPVSLPAPADKLRNPEQMLAAHYRWRTANWKSEADTFVARTMRDAEEWLHRNHGLDPFFLYVDTFDPHEPWDPPEYLSDYFDPGYGGDVIDHPRYDYCDYLTEAEIRHTRALYAGEVGLVDRWVGRLLQTIEHLGLYENTAVIFMSDHGHMIGDHGRIGKSGFGPDGAWPYYEATSHLAFIARVPGGARGERSDYLFQPLDFMPTLLELAGAPLPAGVQGQSVVPILRGESGPTREVAVTSAALNTSRDQAPCSSITDGEWTLHYRGPHWPAELYHLREDPDQTRNLYADNHDEARRLHAAYLETLALGQTPDEKLAARRQLP